MPKTVGIDLGTTNSVIAVMEGGEPVVIPNSEGSRTTPSVVAFTKSGERLVGTLARRQAAVNPENTVYSIKRFMGRKFAEVDSERKIVPYQVKPGKDDRAVVFVPNANKEFTPDVVEGGLEVKPTNGDPHWGGDDYGRRIVDWLADEFKKQNGIALKPDRQALQRLTEAAERAKIELSSRLETTVNLPFITADQTGPKHLEMTLTRAKFESLTTDLTERTRGPFLAALKDASLTPQQIDEVVLVGGSTRMPIIQQLVKDLLGGKEPHKGVNPDEVVAVGAAIQAGGLKGEVKDILLLDVTPLSLGVETLGGVATKVIERNTTIPTSRSQVFSTAADNQSSVEIHVLQGEREMARDNRTLGRFHLDGIPPAPRGMPQIEVTFDIDANGILNVTAKDLGTGKENKITITASTKLSKDQKEKMVHEAEQFAELDKKKREEVELHNNAESMLYTAEKTKDEVRGKIGQEQVQAIDKAAGALRAALSSKEPDKIKAASDELSKTLQKVGAEIYQNVAAQQAPQGGTQGASGQKTGSSSEDDNVVDADFKEVKSEGSK